MKSPFLPALLCAAVAATAADPKPSAPAAEKPQPGPKPAESAPAPDLASFKTAAELWKHVQTLTEEPKIQPKSREEFISILTKWMTDQQVAANHFLQRFPDDANRHAARLISARAALQLARLPGAPPQDASAASKTFAEILAAPDASEEVKGEAAFFQTMNSLSDLRPDDPDASAKFFQESDAFLTKYPAHKLALQMQQMQMQVASQGESPAATAALEKLAGSSNERISGAARQALARQKKMAELKTKPLDLKFTAADGTEVDLAKLRGKVVLVDFWASWCGPCIAEMPNVVAAYEKLHEKGFEIVGISLDQDKTAMEAAMKKHKMTWQQYFDGKGWSNEISTSFGINSIPATWLVDKKGMVRETSLRGEALGKGVEKLLAE